MQLPLQITLRGMEPSDALEARIRKLAQRFERFSPQIVRCHVIVEAPHRHGHKGHLFEVHIQLTTPGDTIAVNREHREHHSHEDVYVALRDAFRAARRQLEDYERERRQDIKHHEPEPSGWVSELYPAEDFGRIATSDGRSVYFHRHSVVGASFDQLNTGMPVHFVEEVGERGPQASTVRPLAHSGPVS
jgi:cold shock CspA family protein/ribosome-associated translation inhibitor RaiA